ncbi:MAG TPA: purple acid phosphatase [Nitrososphaeraceae archaeon]|nr:purple acid phosphatase [Nitrososphaeraceae archaeon]
MIIINYHIINLLAVIVLFSLVLFSNNSLLKRNMEYEEDNLINEIFAQNRNVFAVEMDLEDDGKGNESDEDEDKSFDYVFDPSYYIVEDIDSEKKLDANTNNNIENNDTKSITEYDNGILPHDNKEDDDQKSATAKINTTKITSATKLNKEKESNEKSDFNLVAVGDWDCNSETKDTVENIVEQDPEVVLALGDLSYNGKAKCWLNIIEPIADKTKIVIGNHETDSSKILKDYMQYFGLEKQYYSFNYKNVHFIALSTEIPYEEGSQQYEFVVQDLEKYSKDRTIDWIVAFYHRQAYSSGGGPDDEDDFTETYHPLFDKYNVVLALQGHFHAYERSYPITFNNDDEDEPIVTDADLDTYTDPKGTIFVTAGTGGAHDMKISKSKPFSAFGLDGEFGIVNIAVENDGTVLKSSFIENNGDEDIYDQFQIVKENIKDKR